MTPKVKSDLAIMIAAIIALAGLVEKTGYAMREP